MPVIEFGTKMKSPFLEQWRPEPGTLTVISLLRLNPIGTRSHWVDLPEISMKDRCECVEGVCCQAFKQAWLTYYFPIWVYDTPSSVEGSFYILAATATQYRNLINLAQAGDLMHFDVQVQCTQQGTGIQVIFSVIAHSPLRESMNDEMKAKLEASVMGFYSSEKTLCRPMTVEAYNQLLMQVNYDFRSGLPLIRKENNSSNAGFYPQGVPGVPQYPQVPTQVLQTAQQIPNQIAPPAPQVPAAPVMPQQPVPPVQPAPQVQAPPVTAAPPIPTAPQETVPPPVPAAPVGPQPTSTNKVSPEELASMLE